MKLISWNITKECDLSCQHCYRDAGKKAEDELSTQEAKDLLSEIKNAGFRLVIFSGGEPLLRKDIFELIEYANSLRLISSLGTNGLLLDSETAKELRELKLSSAGISIDSVTPAYHEYLRRSKGCWQKAIDATRNCRQAGLDFQVHTTLTKDNFLDIPEFVNLSTGLGATAHYFFFLVPCGRAKDIEDWGLSLSEHQTALRLIIDGRRTSSIYLRPVCAPQFVLFTPLEKAADFNPIREQRSSLMGFTQGGEKGCLAGTEYCLISPEGNVHPCPYLPITIGNVRQERFSEIWEDSAVFNDLRDLTKYKGKCGKCKYAENCRGCRARAYQASSDYLGEDIACSYQPLNAKS